MPDISMCKNETCRMRKTCYRFTANPNSFQAYADFKPSGWHCKWYEKIDGLPAKKAGMLASFEKGEMT